MRYLKYKTVTAFLISLIISFSATAADKPSITTYKSASCACCERWNQHMQDNGFEVKSHNVSDLSAVKKNYGVPMQMQACHTAVINDYFIEGHMPAADVHKLIKEKPVANGIVVPGMPMGSPGMESLYKQPYQVFLVNEGQQPIVYTTH